MQVRELMSTDPVTVDVEASLRTAVGRLLEHGVGSVIVTRDDEPTGIVTESDALSAAHDRNVPLSEIPVSALVHQPLITTRPDRTVQRVAREMRDNDVKKVVVLEGIDLVGIITLTDVVWGLSEIRSEAIDLGEMNEEWNP